MHRDAYDLRHGPKRRTSVEQIFVEVLNSPIRWRGRGEAGQRQGRREHMFGEAGICVFGIKRIDQQGIVRLDAASGFVPVKRRWSGHLPRDPTLLKYAEERFVRRDHCHTLHYKVLRVNKKGKALLRL